MPIRHRIRKLVISFLYPSLDKLEVEGIVNMINTEVIHMTHRKLPYLSTHFYDHRFNHRMQTRFNSFLLNNYDKFITANPNYVKNRYYVK